MAVRAFDTAALFESIAVLVCNGNTLARYLSTKFFVVLTKLLVCVCVCAGYKAFDVSVRCLFATLICYPTGHHSGLLTHCLCNFVVLACITSSSSTSKHGKVGITAKSNNKMITVFI